MFTRASLTKLIADLADKPNLNPEDLKAYFDNSPTELKNAINLLEQELEAQTAAGQLGATPLNEFSGSTVQAILEYLKGQIDNVALGTIPDNSLTTAKMATEQKRGVAGGVASLDATGNVPLTELSNIEIPNNVVIGSYVGDGTGMGRFISTGKTPAMVIVQGNAYTLGASLFIKNNPNAIWRNTDTNANVHFNNYNIDKIVTNGFTTGQYTNTINKTYFYVAILE